MRAVADQQILRGTAATLRWQYLDSAGEPIDPGTVTVGVTRADGTVVLAAGTATTVSGTERTVALTAAQTASLDVLTATWTRTADSTTFTTKAEIVGGYYFTLAQMRASDPTLADNVKYPDSVLQAARAEIESEFEEICEVAFVPRYRREAINGATMLLPTPFPRRIVAVSELDSAGTATAWSASDVAAVRIYESGTIVSPVRSFPSGTRNVVVAWEHGYDRPPPDVRQAALLRLRHRATRPISSIPDRSTSFQIEGGSIWKLDTAGRKRTGIPEVDGVLDRWSMAFPGCA